MRRIGVVTTPRGAGRRTIWKRRVCQRRTGRDAAGSSRLPPDPTEGAEAARLRGAMRSRRAHGWPIVLGEGKGLKGCTARTGKPASALDPLVLTPAFG